MGDCRRWDTVWEDDGKARQLAINVTIPRVDAFPATTTHPHVARNVPSQHARWSECGGGGCWARYNQSAPGWRCCTPLSSRWREMCEACVIVPMHQRVAVPRCAYLGARTVGECVAFASRAQMRTKRNGNDLGMIAYIRRGGRVTHGLQSSAPICLTTNERTRKGKA